MQRSTVSSWIFAFAIVALAPLALANLGEEEGAENTDTNYLEGRAAVEKKEWQRAIEHLTKAAQKDKNNADVHNLLGFSYRNSGKLDLAFKHYNEAIKLNPKHRDAHEYLGEAYLMSNNLDKAKEQFRNLERLCPRGCEQLDMLKAKIDDHQKKSAQR